MAGSTPASQGGAATGESTSNASVSVATFVENLGTNINGLNLVELQIYLATSKVINWLIKADDFIEKRTLQIARKVSGYAKAKSSRSVGTELQDERTSATTALHAVETFISCLTHGAEGQSY